VTRDATPLPNGSASRGRLKRLISPSSAYTNAPRQCERPFHRILIPLQPGGWVPTTLRGTGAGKGRSLELGDGLNQPTRCIYIIERGHLCSVADLPHAGTKAVASYYPIDER